jgi:hypothetical protein
MDDSARTEPVQAVLPGDNPTATVIPSGTAPPVRASVLQPAPSVALAEPVVAASGSGPAADEPTDGQSPGGWVEMSWRQWLWRHFGYTAISAGIHMAVFVVLALSLGRMEIQEKKAPISFEVEEVTRAPDLLKIELDPHLTLVTQRTQALSSNAEMIRQAAGAVEGGGGGGGGGGGSGAAGSGSGPGPGGPGRGLGIDPSVFTRTGPGMGFGVGDIMLDMPGTGKLIGAVPDGAIGDSRAVVGGYAEAMDRLAQELLWMLDKGPVLAIWLFDESESMKDDQKEIRERFEHVYRQLGLLSDRNEGALETAICSYGKNFSVRTRQPTHDQGQIAAAIEQIPLDESGVEMMCSSVQQALNIHRPYAQRTRRQIAMIVVTDESGDRNDNEVMLERAINECKVARARVYMLAREAVFGYPYAHIRWQHPQTLRIHWLPIDRGPETAFVEQLQTDGLHRRYDAHPSGFGPYESTRMARETGGIFFMLPSLETNLVRGQKRNYDMEAPYNPDLRSRAEVKADIDKSPLRTGLQKIIYDLNPYNAEARRIIELRIDGFSTDYNTLLQQVRQEHQKATVYLPYLAKAEQAVAKLESFRQQEASPRWQANYDLLYAQLVSYQARLPEYIACLDEFAKDLQAYLKNPGDPKNKFKPPPASRKDIPFTDWHIRSVQRTRTGDKIKPLVERSSAMFKQLMADHPSTPWAARADWELRRGFGIELVPDYEPRRTPTGPVKPVPKY